MRRMVLLALLFCTTIFPGCFMAREFQAFGTESGKQLGWLCKGPIMDVSYLNDLNQNTTRSDSKSRQISQEIDMIWKDLLETNRPEQPISLASSPERIRGVHFAPEKKSIISPPARTTIERIGDFLIIRTPDGRITVTNRAEAGEMEG